MDDPVTASGADCPFCRVAVERIAFVATDVVGLWDASPVSEGHLVLASRRHAPAWTDLTTAEQQALFEAIGQGYALLAERFGPDGVNVGWDDGDAAGQGVGHVHIHMIPRRRNDAVGGRGGMRAVIPQRGDDSPAPSGWATARRGMTPRRMAGP